MMDELIAGFPAQLREALEIARSVQMEPADDNIHQAYVAGMGGSGIGADFVRAFVASQLRMPYLTGKGYDIPAFIGPHSLFIASSYSGNTEETINAAHEAFARGARVVCVASGGKLLDWANVNGLGRVKVPGGSPSPRACLGYSVVAQLGVLHALGLIDDQPLRNIDASATLLDRAADDIRSRAQMTAQFIHNKLPVIYASDQWTPVCVRFRQQLNENSKILAWHHVLPEMNHNELVGWRDIQRDKAVIFLRSKLDDPRTATRTDITKGIISELTDTVMEVYAKGSSLIEQAFYLVHFADWVSWYLAELRKVDAVEIKVIDFLKEQLSKVE